MEKSQCRTCFQVKSADNFYKNKDGQPIGDCKSCFNFMRSVGFLDYAAGKKKRFDSPEKQEIAERILRRQRVKKALTSKMP